MAPAALPGPHLHSEVGRPDPVAVPLMNAADHGRRFPLYGWAGLVAIILAEVLLAMGVRFIGLWMTPICWYGYILLADGLVEKLRGGSMITSWRRPFLWMFPISAGLWVIFEFYNLFLDNWHYVGLYESRLLRYTAYALAFATITPGIMETRDLVTALTGWDRWRTRPWVVSDDAIRVFIVMGLAMVILPLAYPSRYVFAPVWGGFVLLCDPLNYLLRRPSLLGDLAEGKPGRIVALLVAGGVCGFLWEFWNYWAVTKWIYTVPFTENIKIFEMPLLGFVGFFPFAWECFCMYHLVAGARDFTLPQVR